MDQDTERPSCLVKVNNQDFTNQLKLPLGVMNFFNGVEIPDEIVLRRISHMKGRSWFVDLVKIEEEEDGYVLCKAGWSDFVKDFALAFEDRLLFEYNGNSQILFRVYDNNTGIPKDLVCRNMISALPNQNNVNVEQREAKEELVITVSDDVDDSSLDHQDEHGDSEVDEQTAARGESLIIDGNAWVRKVLKDFVSEHPSFAVHITQRTSISYLNILNIPRAFAEKNLPKAEKTFELVRGSKGGETSWKVVMRSSNNYFWRFTTGWTRCAQDIGLQEGDICVFELIDGAKMQLWIYRVRGETVTRN